MMRTLDASRWQILWRVEAPTALPFAFSGAKIAVTFAPIAAVFGEWVGADSGLGAPDARGQRQPGDRADVRRDRGARRRSPSRSSAWSHSRSAASSLGDRKQGMRLARTDPGRDRRRPPGARPRPRRLRREERGRHRRRADSVQADARLLPQPRPRRDLHGAEARLLPRRRPRPLDRDALRPGGADPAGRRRPHRPGHLL